MKRLSFAAFALFCLLALTGCSTAYYQDRAVSRAREYLLENAPELTPAQIAYVKYNKPVLLMENIFDPKEVASVQDLNQIAVTWVIPGQENTYLVCGFSEERMMLWYPNRLVRRTFPKVNPARASAISTARRYVLDKLYFEIDSHEYNFARFADPEIIRTDFEILPVPPKSRIQYSLVWREKNSDRAIVICGTSAPDLGGFSIAFGGVLRARELADATVPADKEKK